MRGRGWERQGKGQTGKGGAGIYKFFASLENRGSRTQSADLWVPGSPQRELSGPHHVGAATSPLATSRRRTLIKIEEERGEVRKWGGEEWGRREKYKGRWVEP